MGFEKTLRSIAAVVRPDRQTLVLANSASREVGNLANFLLRDHVMVTIGYSKLAENERVEQTVIVCEKPRKLDRLVTLFEDILKKKDDKVIVFVETRSNVDKTVFELQLRGWSVAGIHGAKTRDERRRAMDAFKSGLSSILVVTDVAAQQVDVGCVRYVVHYDRPANADVYVNRVNCASHCDGSGVAYAFLAPDDARHAKELVFYLRDAGQEEMSSTMSASPEDYTAALCQKDLEWYEEETRIRSEWTRSRFVRATVLVTWTCGHASTAPIFINFSFR
ncbi:hypothetical protein HPB51_024642 [Rhipicephalus microplus]|uniref:Helicase C-terminal domain-containing protein n=1 Tax=Rhipicephalus microplus TaxID=6941 RepID=A0A9J6EPE9_RHIMP|nr:hypothetical protein HPB51_024642 [Rhipicephalus microplus]